MGWITTGEGWAAFLTLCVLEVVLGVDNLIFLSITSSKLPRTQQGKARVIGLSLAIFMRIALILSITWLIGLTAPIFTVFGREVSWRDLILIAGGLFLIAKSTREIHDTIEGAQGGKPPRAAPSFTSAVIQIVLLDAVFSLDTLITAVGLVQQV